MTGHTHDDVDQMFSRFAQGLRKQNHVIYSVPQLIEVMRNSYTPTPVVEFLHGCRDWKSLLDQHSTHGNSRSTQLHGHLRPHQFSFRKREEDWHARLKFKLWARSERWFPVNEDTPDILPMHSQCTFRHIEPLPYVATDRTLAKQVLKTFKIAARFGVPGNAIAEMLDYVNVWACMTATTPPMPAVRNAPILRRRKFWLQLDDGESKAGASDDSGSIFEGDVSTDEEELVYYGNLHSRDPNAPTSKKNFVDFTELEVGQFVMVRVDEEGDNAKDISLAKVLDFSHEARTCTVHWYGAAGSGRAQGPLVKEVPTTATAGSKRKRPKSKPYTSLIEYDSVVITEDFQLTKAKTVPMRIVKKAKLRAQNAIKIVLRKKGKK